MPTLWIVGAFDVVEDICARLFLGAVGLPPDPFGFQRREEAFHRRVVPDISGPAHRTGDAVISHQPLERFASILAALVGMMQQLLRSTSAPDCHDQGIRDHLGRHLIAHGPAGASRPAAGPDTFSSS